MCKGHSDMCYAALCMHSENKVESLEWESRWREKVVKVLMWQVTDCARLYLESTAANVPHVAKDKCPSKQLLQWIYNEFCSYPE